MANNITAAGSVTTSTPLNTWEHTHTHAFWNLCSYLGQHLNPGHLSGASYQTDAVFFLSLWQSFNQTVDIWRHVTYRRSKVWNSFSLCISRINSAFHSPLHPWRTFTTCWDKFYFIPTPFPRENKTPDELLFWKAEKSSKAKGLTPLFIFFSLHQSQARCFNRLPLTVTSAQCLAERAHTHTHAEHINKHARTLTNAVLNIGRFKCAIGSSQSCTNYKSSKYS